MFCRIWFQINGLVFLIWWTTRFLLTSDNLLTICSSVNQEDNQIPAFLSTTPNNRLSLYQFRFAKPFIRCKNERKGYFSSMIIRAFTMVTDLLRFIHLVMFYLIINGELHSLLPSHKAYVKSFVQRGTGASDCGWSVHRSVCASPGTVPMAGTCWVRTTGTTRSRNLSEHLGDTTYLLWHHQKSLTLLPIKPLIKGYDRDANINICKHVRVLRWKMP